MKKEKIEMQLDKIKCCPYCGGDTITYREVTTTITIGLEHHYFDMRKPMPKTMPRNVDESIDIRVDYYCANCLHIIADEDAFLTRNAVNRYLNKKPHKRVPYITMATDED